ncbi:uncharacterized protein [Heterodontus francisci]|uniref:uncharacterized protein n=1 Tax=Heterodontus francisci TaxID=7792 RepID=UPI00355BF995
MGQDVRNAPSINIGDHALEVVQEFTYLGSTITSNLSLDAEINKRMGKASTAMSRLAKRVWENGALTRNTKVRVCQACVLSTLFDSSEAWTTYVSQERRLNSFHIRYLWRIPGIRWQDRISNTEVLEAANIPSIYTLLSQRRLRWLGHVSRTEDGRIPNDTLYSELATGIRPTGRPCLRFKDGCKSDMKSCDIDHKSWQSVASDRQSWRAAIKAGLKCGETKRLSCWQEKRQKRKGRANCVTAPTTNFICSACGRVCHSRIGLYSHSRRCFTNHRPPLGVYPLSLETRRPKKTDCLAYHMGESMRSIMTQGNSGCLAVPTSLISPKGKRIKTRKQDVVFIDNIMVHCTLRVASVVQCNGWEGRTLATNLSYHQHHRDSRARGTHR